MRFTVSILKAQFLYGFHPDPVNISSLCEEKILAVRRYYGAKIIAVRVEGLSQVFSFTPGTVVLTKADVQVSCAESLWSVYRRKKEITLIRSDERIMLQIFCVHCSSQIFWPKVMSIHEPGSVDIKRTKAAGSIRGKVDCPVLCE